MVQFTSSSKQEARAWAGKQAEGLFGDADLAGERVKAAPDDLMPLRIQRAGKSLKLLLTVEVQA